MIAVTLVVALLANQLLKQQAPKAKELPEFDEEAYRKFISDNQEKHKHNTLSKTPVNDWSKSSAVTPPNLESTDFFNPEELGIGEISPHPKK